MKARDLSPADVEALKELRLRQMIRIDEAGRHAESLERMAKAEVIDFASSTTDVPAADRTEAQIALGFTDKGGTGSDGVEYASAPYWRWATATGLLAHGAAAMLRELEGRRPIDMDWEDFCSFVEECLGKHNKWPTVADVAAKFGHSVLDTVDWIDARYWAGRGGRGLIETHEIVVEGE